jgi:tetratricopeptide (TPR) repeat protein
MARLMREAAALGGKAAAGAARNLEVAEHNAAAQRLNEDAAKLQGLQALADRDPEAAWARFNALPVPAETELRRFRRGVGAYVAAKRAERVLRSGEDCTRVDAAVADWLSLLDVRSESPGQIRAACRSLAANGHFAAGRFAEALTLHREAQRLAPGDPAHGKNVVACLGNLANAHVRAGRCDRARPLLEEARRLAPRDAGLAELQRQCLGR